MTHSLNGLNSRLEIAKGKISELEGKSIEMTQSEEMKKIEDKGASET